jgi:hypothetical protein
MIASLPTASASLTVGTVRRRSAGGRTALRQFHAAKPEGFHEADRFMRQTFLANGIH